MTKPLTITHTWELKDDRYCDDCMAFDDEYFNCDIFGGVLIRNKVSGKYPRIPECIEKFGMGEKEGI